MLSKILDFLSDKNWTYAILKVLQVVIFSLFLYFYYNFDINNLAVMRPIIIPAAIGIVSAMLIMVLSLMQTIKKYLPFLVIPLDWILVAAYVFFFPVSDLWLICAILMIITLSGIMYVGSLFGIVEVIGSLLIGFFFFINREDIALEAIQNDPSYYPPLIFAFSALLLVLAWHNNLDEENNRSRKLVRREIEESRKRLEHMRDRTNSIAEMAARLNSTLNYDRILDAAMDLGRMSVRDDVTARLTSMALMVTDESGMLTIENARGLQYTDENHKFAGESGLIAQAIDEGKPVIHAGGSDDSELGVLTAFAQVRTTLVIPLRANYETYGVLVFGSTAPNAINEDHIDTLAAIGLQTTIALQNAVLYSNLRDEKERILRIEENGRKALVRDLHDIPTQTVSAVAMHLSMLPMIQQRSPETLLDEIQNIREMTLRATEEIRHVMFTLRPLSLEANGLTTALDQLAEKMQKTYKQPMQVKVDQQVESILSKDEQGTLFYLIEEAANNARKYAQASMIRVIATRNRNGDVIVKVADNGKGFDVNAVDANYESRGSFGMVNMRERAELINGTLAIKSVPGKGTTITVTVPSEDENFSERVHLLKPRKPLRKQYSGPVSPAT